MHAPLWVETWTQAAVTRVECRQTWSTVALQKANAWAAILPSLTPRVAPGAASAQAKKGEAPTGPLLGSPYIWGTAAEWASAGAP